MTTKFLSGVYNNGYTLSGLYSALSITSTGFVRGTSPTGYDSAGGIGVLLNFAATMTNSGSAVGGEGAEGAPGAPYAMGDTGGVGGVAVSLTAGGTVVNGYDILGGVGGAGGGYSSHFASGGAGGAGGAGIDLAAGGRVTNTDLIKGGPGGAGGAGSTGRLYGGYGYYRGYLGGYGGQGGAGVALHGGGSVLNKGVIYGGVGGAGGTSGSHYMGINYSGDAGHRGDGVDLGVGGKITNGAGTATGALIYGGIAVYGASADTVTNFGTISGLSAGIWLIGGGLVTNGGSTVRTALIESYTGIVASGTATVVNFGTIKGSSQALNIGSSVRLIAEPSSVCIGNVQGGGVLELAGGGGTIRGLGSLGTLTGDIAMTFFHFGAYVIDAGAWTLPGFNALAGSLTLGDGATILAQDTLADSGALTIASTGSATRLEVIAAGLTLSGGGVVSLAGSKAQIVGASPTATLVNSDTIAGTGFVGAGSMTLVNQKGGVIKASATGSLVVKTPGETLVNGGLLESTLTGASLVLNATTVDQTGGGTIAATAGRVDLQNAEVIGGTLATSGTGLIRLSSGASILDATTQSISLAGEVQVSGSTTLTAAGAISGSGKLNLNSGKLIIGAAGLTLSGGGQVNLNNSTGNTVIGATAAATLTNFDDRISGAGALGGGSMALVNEVPGVIIGNQNLALNLDTGTSVILNAGLIENVGKGGTVVKSGLDNTGTVLAATTGTLTLAGAVTGAGVAQINGGTLYVERAFAEKVTFTGSTGVLKLGDSRAFTGKVAGLSKTGTNSLDLVDIGFVSGTTKASYSGTTASGTLTVTDGTHTAHIVLVGNYTVSTFTVSSDGHGGTSVVDPAIRGLSQAMVAFAPRPMAPAALASSPRQSYAQLARPA
jgi:hypothetical protein